MPVGDTDLGPNPKINNLFQPFSRAKHDLLYVLDSGILLASPHHLARSVDAFLLSPSCELQGKRRVSLVHHVPFAIIPPPGNRGLGSWLERAFLNTNHAKMYLAINRYVPASRRDCLSSAEVSLNYLACQDRDRLMCHGQVELLSAFGCPESHTRPDAAE